MNNIYGFIIPYISMVHVYSMVYFILESFPDHHRLFCSRFFTSNLPFTRLLYTVLHGCAIAITTRAGLSPSLPGFAGTSASRMQVIKTAATCLCWELSLTVSVVLKFRDFVS